MQTLTLRRLGGDPPWYEVPADAARAVADDVFQSDRLLRDDGTLRTLRLAATQLCGGDAEAAYTKEGASLLARALRGCAAPLRRLEHARRLLLAPSRLASGGGGAVCRGVRLESLVHHLLPRASTDGDSQVEQQLVDSTLDHICLHISLGWCAACSPATTAAHRTLNEAPSPRL